MSYGMVSTNSSGRRRTTSNSRNKGSSNGKASISSGSNIPRRRNSGGGTRLVAKSLPYSTTGYVPNYSSKTKGRNWT